MNVKDLRPLVFPVEAGTEVLNILTGGKAEFVAGPDKGGVVALKSEKGAFYLMMGANCAIPPLAYVEDRPVYKGDVLYHKMQGGKWVVNSFDGTYLRCGEDDDGWFCTSLTWTKPKIKKSGWFNLYKDKHGEIEFGHRYITKDKAITESDPSRTLLDTMYIEWEE